MATLTDGELFKKTLRTTLVMLGTTAVWLGALSGAVIFTTTPSVSTASESKSDKAAGPTPASLPSPRGMAPAGAGVVPSPRSIHPSRPRETAHAGDPI